MDACVNAPAYDRHSPEKTLLLPACQATLPGLCDAVGSRGQVIARLCVTGVRDVSQSVDDSSMAFCAQSETAVTRS